MVSDGEQQLADVTRELSVRSMTSWTIAILLLSPVSVVSYRLLQLLPGGTGPVGDVLYWILLPTFFLCGILGFLGFVPATVLAIIATFSHIIPVRRKLVMWICVVVSLVALIYLNQNVRS